MNMVRESPLLKPLPVKICGLKTEADVAAALAGGAGWLGFMMYGPSPRNVAPEVAGALAAPARGRAAVVAVAVDADDALIDRIMVGLAPDALQLHGHERPERARVLKQRTGVTIIRALRVGSAADIDAARAFDDAADLMLYDARPPEGSVLPGGNGVRFDWSLAAAIPRDRDWFLAGGLTPENVREAIAATGAPLLDVSSGVERTPGYKDPDLIRAFLDAAREGLNPDSATKATL
jgi:phosphoribosylanthranilate isomerase